MSRRLVWKVRRRQSLWDRAVAVRKSGKEEKIWRNAADFPLHAELVFFWISIKDGLKVSKISWNFCQNILHWSSSMILSGNQALMIALKPARTTLKMPLRWQFTLRSGWSTLIKICCFVIRRQEISGVRLPNWTRKNGATFKYIFRSCCCFLS